MTTSYKSHKDFGGAHMIGYQLQYGYSLNTYVHSHPSGNAEISRQDSKMVNNLKGIFTELPECLLYIPNTQGPGLYFRFKPATLPQFPLIYQQFL